MSADPATLARRQQSSSAGVSRTAASAAPKPPCTIHPSAIVSDKAVITGTHPVTIGENAVLHPFSKITSLVSPVHIGKNCIVAERATVGLTQKMNDGHEQDGVKLGENVSVETGSVVEARLLGEGTVVEVNAFAGRGTTAGRVLMSFLPTWSRTDHRKFCKISASCTVSGEDLPDYTVIYGNNERRIDSTVQSRADVRDLKLKGQAMHIDTLRRLIPSNIAKWQS